MPLRHVLLAAGLAAAEGCKPLRQWWSGSKVRTWTPGALPAHVPGEIVLIMEKGAPERAGLSLWGANGSEMASADCELSHRPVDPRYAFGDLARVTCPTPPLAPGNYSMRFSSDRSCGSSSYAPLDGEMEVVEPAHPASLSPEHGPEKGTTSVTVYGRNFGGPHVYCQLSFPPAPGARFGCGMTESNSPGKNVTPTSVVCDVPAWPGPLMQYQGNGTFTPTEGAVCAREVHLRISNDAKVDSLEVVVFRYDEAAELVLV